MKHTLKGIASTREYFLDGKYLDPARSQRVWNHSPDGFNHGYSGSGPAQLALAIMLELTGKPDGYQNFKFKFVAALPQGQNFEVDFELDEEKSVRKPYIKMSLEELEIELQEVYDKGDNTEEEENMLIKPLESLIKEKVRKLSKPLLTDSDSWWTGRNRIKTFVSWQDALSYWESKQIKNEKF